jgi:hypothetical protein
VPLIVAVVE